MKRATRKRFKLVLIVLVLMITIYSSVSYFVDRADFNDTETAGTVIVNLDTSKSEIFDNSKNIFGPGDAISLEYSVESAGSKSVDVRTIVTVSSSIPMDKQAEQAEFEVYNRADVKYIEGMGYEPIKGAKPLQIRSLSEDGCSITYILDDYILNGSIEKEKDFVKPKGSIYTNDDGTKTTFDYVLVFKRGSSNTYQGATVSYTIKVEVKQHRNTEAGWGLVADKTEEIYTKYE